MGKEVKTNAMRILDKNKIPYEILNYECGEFIDGLHTAEATGAPVEQSFKTLVMQGKSRQHYVFAIPIADEVDLKAARQSRRRKIRGDDSRQRHHCHHGLCPRRLLSSRHEKAVPDHRARERCGF